MLTFPEKITPAVLLICWKKPGLAIRVFANHCSGIPL
jgi:hypothetical protein